MLTAASHIALDVFNCYSYLIETNLKHGKKRKEPDDYDPITQMAFGLQSMYNPELIDHRVNYVLPEVIMSISLHNIYPSSLKPESKPYINSVDKSPFNFFCILADSLQPWDRKRNVNQALRSTQYTTFGNNFDLRIVKDKIQIHEEGQGVNIDERVKALRTFLDDYLLNAHYLIKVSIAEYNKTTS